MGWIDLFNLIIVVYFVGLNGTYSLTGLLAFWELRKHNAQARMLAAEELILDAGVPPISIVAPSYNEEATAVEAVRALLTLEYPNYEVVIVNDGSKDRTVEVLTEAFGFRAAARAPTHGLETKTVRGIYRSTIHEDLWLVDKENGGKADALNVGINFCHAPFFCAIDADTLLDRDALSRIVRPFLEDDETVASGGVIRVANDCVIESGMVRAPRVPKGWLAGFQVVEYLRSFLTGRVGWNALGATLIISGAFGLFRRSTVVAAGGFESDTVGEDMELVVRLHRHCRERREPYRIVFVPDPVAWTEVPESIDVLVRQRDRWQRGLWDTLFRHMKLMFNPRYGTIGMIAFPFFFFFELLGPSLEVAGYVIFVLAAVLGMISWENALMFFLLSFVMGAALSIAAVAQEELAFRRYSRLRDVLRLMLLALVENFGFRQMNALWRFKGLISAIRKKHEWGAMTRTGFGGSKQGDVSRSP